MIKTQNLTKNFDGLLAVDDLTFSVEPGEVLGFLGPNGAGKSTSMRMIAGFITPTSGTARICGHDVTTDPIAAKPAACQFMLVKLKPTMAALLGMPPFSPDTKVGFSCMNCHER